MTLTVVLTTPDHVPLAVWRLQLAHYALMALLLAAAPRVALLALPLLPVAPRHSCTAFLDMLLLLLGVVLCTALLGLLKVGGAAASGGVIPVS